MTRATHEIVPAIPPRTVSDRRLMREIVARISAITDSPAETDGWYRIHEFRSVPKQVHNFRTRLIGKFGDRVQFTARIEDGVGRLYARLAPPAA